MVINYIEIFNIIAQFLIVLIGFCALKQIRIMRQQSQLTREAIAINELREFEKVLNDFEIFLQKVTEKNTFKLKSIEMYDFNLTESSSFEFKKDMEMWHIFLNNNKNLFSDAVRIANKMEIFATTLEKGTASVEVVQDVIATTFCLIVENLAYIYVINRNDSINLFKNTITLYKKFKPIVGKNIENAEKIKKEVERILNKK